MTTKQCKTSPRLTESADSVKGSQAERSIWTGRRSIETACVNQIELHGERRLLSWDKYLWRRLAVHNGHLKSSDEHVVNRVGSHCCSALWLSESSELMKNYESKSWCFLLISRLWYYYMTNVQTCVLLLKQFSLICLNHGLNAYTDELRNKKWRVLIVFGGKFWGNY